MTKINNAIEQAAEDYRIANNLTPMTLIEASCELQLANNGYTYAAGMNPEFIRQAERLVSRGLLYRVMLPSRFEGAHEELAYALPRAVEAFNFKTVD
jgi:hypothetical protein